MILPAIDRMRLKENGFKYWKVLNRWVKADPKIGAVCFKYEGEEIYVPYYSSLGKDIRDFYEHQ